MIASDSPGARASRPAQVPAAGACPTVTCQNQSGLEALKFEYSRSLSIVAASLSGNAASLRNSMTNSRGAAMLNFAA